MEILVLCQIQDIFLVVAVVEVILLVVQTELVVMEVLAEVHHLLKLEQLTLEVAEAEALMQEIHLVEDQQVDLV
jgi:hypothetical protein